MNGAEVVYRASYPHPATGNEMFEIQSRARALDNNMYLVAPNMGAYYLFPEETTPIDTFGRRSFIIDYKGRIVGRQEYGAGSSTARSSSCWTEASGNPRAGRPEAHAREEGLS